ncbi:MAG: polysaccharide biosynthesis tyrosine autokinase [Elainella sp. C42_A2020_010]|nr:polysaccharide biosynthesis tyrosine autokinase [Elainella sp. C42_A2020_010]
MTVDPLKSAANDELSYGQLFAVLWRRSLWLVGTFGLIVGTSMLITLFSKPTYRSSMQLLVEPNYQLGLKQNNERNTYRTDRQDEVDYATQLNLIRSYQFMEQALERLKGAYPDLTIKEIRKNLTISLLEEGKVETKIVEVVYTDNDDIKTQRMLEAIQEIYQDYNLKQQKLRLDKGLALINEQLEMLRQELSSSQQQLERFRQNQNLIDPEEQATTVAEALEKVLQDQREVQAEYRDAQAKYASLQQQLALSPRNALIASRLSQSTRYQELLNELQKTELELAQNQVIYTDITPRIKSLQERRQKQLELLQQEMGRVLGAEASASGESLLTAGQLSKNDLELAQDLAETQSLLAGLAARQRSLAQSEQQLRQELNRFPSLIAQYDRLQPEVETQRVILEKLLEDRQELSNDLLRGGFNWEVVEAPQLGEKISPKPLQNLLLGAVIGIFLGTIAAFTREMLDNVIRSLEDLKQQIEQPLLGTLPALSSLQPHHRWSFQAAPAVPTIQTLWHPKFRESLDLIYKNLQIQNPGKLLKSLVVTSASVEEGKTSLVLGLALSAARSHRRVLVVDADFRQPAIHQQLGLTNHQGLSMAILELRSANDFIRHLVIADAEIDVLTAGPTPTDPMRLLSSQRFRDLMATFTEHYDLIVVDAPPILGLVDAIQIGSCCSGFVLSARLHQVTRSDLAQAIAMLSSLNLVGVVANNVKLAGGNSGRTTESRALSVFPIPSEPLRQIPPQIDQR